MAQPVTWWIIIHTPDSVYAWPAWPEKDDAGDLVPPDDDLINRARVAVGFPEHDQWPFDGLGWDLQLTLGEPKDTLLARALVGNVDELGKVDAGAVSAHVDARMADARRARREEIVALATVLDDATFADVVAARAASADVVDGVVELQ